LQKRTADIAAGVSTINEERAEDGKEPVDGGEEPLVSSALIPLSQAVKEPEPMPIPDFGTPGPIPVPGNQGRKPKPGGEGDGDSGNIDTGEGDDGKAKRLADAVLRKVREKLGA